MPIVVEARSGSYFRDNDGTMHLLPSEHRLASLSYCDTENADEENVALANARLIAAAPDMKEALTRMVHEYDPDQGYTAETIAFAAAALRKATETP